ncbi:cold-shock protein [Streptomyces sp. NPDC050759]|uniref:cold-shock protein n=1 Tax=Streptomyces sp. NPDC050759 TaxID=3365635 RepID=UPI003797DFB5
MAEGWVRWFNSEKGYGFLTVAGYTAHDVYVGAQDVRVYGSEIQTRGYPSLDVGEYVSFQVARDVKGEPIALHVVPLPAPSQQSLDPQATTLDRTHRLMGRRSERAAAGTAGSPDSSRMPIRQPLIIRLLPVLIPVLVMGVPALLVFVMR